MLRVSSYCIKCMQKDFTKTITAHCLQFVIVAIIIAVNAVLLLTTQNNKIMLRSHISKAIYYTSCKQMQSALIMSACALTDSLCIAYTWFN